MSSEAIYSVRTYALVLAALIVLTLATLGVSLLPLAAGWHTAVGLSIAVVKVSLVAVFFMHLLHGPRLAWVIAFIALIWLLLLIGLTFTDYATRGLIQFMPGH